MYKPQNTKAQVIPPIYTKAMDVGSHVSTKGKASFGWAHSRGVWRAGFMGLTWLGLPFY